MISRAYPPAASAPPWPLEVPCQAVSGVHSESPCTHAAGEGSTFTLWVSAGCRGLAE